MFHSKQRASDDGIRGGEKKRTKRTKRTCEIVTRRVGGARMGWMEKEVELEKEERIYVYILASGTK